MKVLKFGGTSLGDPERMNALYSLISEEEEAIIVLSAVSGTTNKLQELADILYVKDATKFSLKLDKLREVYSHYINELYDNTGFRNKANLIVNDIFRRLLLYGYNFFSRKEEKELLSFGEVLSTNLFALRAEEKGWNVKLISALDFMRLDESGEPHTEEISARLKDQMEEGTNIYITQGYICRDHKGKVDNLKRGGSDYTASLIGEAIHAEEVQIWTDIDGMHNNDPREVEDTEPLNELSYDEAAELAYFGAKVLHPQCVFPVQRAGIPLSIRYTMEPNAQGTLIHNSTSQQGIKSIAAKDKITAIKIKSGRMLMAYGFLRRVFEVFENHRTPIDMITTSEVAVSLTIDNDQYLPQIMEDLEKLGEVEVEKDQAIICIVGDLIADSKGYGSLIFNALKDVPVRMVSYGGSRHNISLLVSESHKAKALNTLHDHIFQLA